MRLLNENDVIAAVARVLGRDHEWALISEVEKAISELPDGSIKAIAIQKACTSRCQAIPDIACFELCRIEGSEFKPCLPCLIECGEDIPLGFEYPVKSQYPVTIE